MGKTRLVTEAVLRWRAVGARVLIGGCVPVEGQPYAPLVTAMRPALPSNAPLLRMLAAGQAASRSDLFDALGSRVMSLAERSPLVLVVEDLHWSDRATRDALAYLVTQVDVGRWGLVATYRYEGPLPANRNHVVRRRARTAADPTRHVGAAFCGSGGRAGRRDPRRRRRHRRRRPAVHRRSGGIPLLVEEVIAAGDSGVPDHLRSLFLARVAEHGPEVTETLRVIAVAETCDELVVAGALGWRPAGVTALSGGHRDADLVVVDAAGYRFRHDLLREAVYDDIPPGRRRELHRRVAEPAHRAGRRRCRRTRRSLAPGRGARAGRPGEHGRGRAGRAGARTRGGARPLRAHPWRRGPDSAQSDPAEAAVRETSCSAGRRTPRNGPARSPEPST